MKAKLNKSKVRGVALITVMLVVALAAILATQMTARLQLQIQRTVNTQSNQQAYWYAMGAEAFASRVMFKVRQADKDITHLGQPWAQGETKFPVDLGEISGEISDLHACLNLNALTPEPDNNSGSNNPSENKSITRQAFEELVISFNLEGVGAFEAEYMADALIDWLDDNSSLVSAGGAEDNDYSAKEYPYLPANSYLASINELRVIEHFTPAVINQLKQVTCVIPNSNLHQININTLDESTPELLQALLGGISKSDAQQILSERPEKGWKDIADFSNLAQVKKIQDFETKYKDQFVVNSDYFKLVAKTAFNNSYFSLTSIMKITKDNQVIVVNRSMGGQ
jgi:general secretion pathway protein K